MSEPAPPVKVSAPTPPLKMLLPLLPVNRLAKALPVPLRSALPVRMSFLKLVFNVALLEVTKVSALGSKVMLFVAATLPTLPSMTS